MSPEKGGGNDPVEEGIDRLEKMAERLGSLKSQPGTSPEEVLKARMAAIPVLPADRRSLDVPQLRALSSELKDLILNTEVSSKDRRNLDRIKREVDREINQKEAAQATPGASVVHVPEAERPVIDTEPVAIEPKDETVITPEPEEIPPIESEQEKLERKTAEEIERALARPINPKDQVSITEEILHLGEVKFKINLNNFPGLEARINARLAENKRLLDESGKTPTGGGGGKNPPPPVGGDKGLEDKDKDDKDDKKEKPVDAAEEVATFVKDFGIEGLLPEGFKDLTPAQQLLIIRNLKSRIIDIVGSNAKTQYSAEFRGKGIGIFKKIKGSFTKASDLKRAEADVFKKLLESDEGKAHISGELIQLTNLTKERKVVIGEGGKPEVEFVNPEDFEGVTKDMAQEFNRAANTFREMPYEWGQGKGKNKEDYDKAKGDYEHAREKILAIRSRKNGEASAVTEIIQFDSIIKLEQIITTHPEVAAEFERIAKTTDGKKIIANGKALFGTGSAALNVGLAVGGYGLKAANTTLNIATGLSGAAGIGAIVGGVRGFFRGKTELREKDVESRHGKKDSGKTRKAVVDTNHLIQRLEKVTKSLENADAEPDVSRTGAQRKVTKADLLKVRIEHVVGKIERGEVDFGDANSALKNQADLMLALNNAVALSLVHESKNKEALEKTLSGVSEGVNEKIKSRRNWFVAGRVAKAAAFGAGAASIGYAVRYAVENWGWWEDGGSQDAPQGATRENWEYNVGKDAPEGVSKYAWEKSTNPFFRPDPNTAWPDHNDHSAGAEEMRRMLKSLGLEEPPPKIPDMEVSSITEQNVTPGAAEHLEPVPGAMAQNIESAPLDQDAVIGKGEGIEHAFRRQIEHDIDLAKKLGYTGDPNDSAALHKFSGSAAHKLAIDQGYVDGPNEVRVRTAGEVAYQVEMDKNGDVRVLERLVDENGKVQETHFSGEKFETNTEKYEYIDTVKKALKEAYETEHRLPDAPKIDLPTEIKIPAEAIAPDVPGRSVETGIEANLEEYGGRGVSGRGGRILGPEDFMDHPKPATPVPDRFPATGQNVIYDSQRGIIPLADPGGSIGVASPQEVIEAAFAGTPVHLPEGAAERIYMKTVDAIFENWLSESENIEVARGAVGDILDLSAKEMSTGSAPINDLHAPVFGFIQKAKEVLGKDFEPKGSGFFRKAESVGDFIKRAIETAAEKGKLGKLLG